MSILGRLRGLIDGSNRVFFDRFSSFGHHILDRANVTLANVNKKPYDRLVPAYGVFVNFTARFLYGCFSNSDGPAIIAVDLRSITPTQGHILFTQTLVGFIMYAGGVNIQALPRLKNARDALLTFAEATTGMEIVVTAAQSRFEALPEFDWGAYIDLIRSNILATIPSEPLDFEASLNFTMVASETGVALAGEIYKAVLGAAAAE